MYPTIQDCEKYQIDTNFPYSKLQVGDIVAYKVDSMCGVKHKCDGWVHRINKDFGNGVYTMKGDNNDHVDDYVLTRQNFVGKVIIF